MKIQALLAALVVGVTGCATRPVTTAEAVPVPPDRVFAYNGAQSTNTGTLLIVRDSGFVGSGCELAFYVDGVDAAHLKPGEAVSLTVPSGNRIVGAGAVGGVMCSGKDVEANRREVLQPVDVGSTVKMRLAYTRDGTIHVTPTAF